MNELFSPAGLASQVLCQHEHSEIPDVSGINDTNAKKCFGNMMENTL